MVHSNKLRKMQKPSVIRQKSESQNGCYKKTKHGVRIRRKGMFVFRKIWRALFSCNTRFTISLFVLLPSKHALE